MLVKWDETNVTLAITTEFNKCNLAYSLDDKSNITVPNNKLEQNFGNYKYNLLLTNLTDGQHTVKAFATDGLGYCGVAEQSFSIGTQQTTQTTQSTQTNNATNKTPVPIILVVAVSTVILATVLVGVILLFYRKQSVDEKTPPST